VTSRALLVGLAAILASACSHDCKTARDCDANQRCVSGSCKDSNASPGQVGDSCAATSECASGLSCESASFGFPNGFCSVQCSTTACTSGSCAGLASGSFCAPTCAADTDCRTGYNCCGSLGGVCVPNGACLPAACTRTINTSALPSAQVIALGVHKVGETIPFDVPAGTASLTIVHQAQTAPLEVVFSGNNVWPNNAVPAVITKPDGSKAYDDNDQTFSINTYSSADGGTDMSGIYSMYGQDSPSTAAFTIPNTSASLDGGLPAGTWKFQVHDWALDCTLYSNLGCTDGGTNADTYDVSVLLKPTPTTNLDVAFYIVGDATTTTGQPFTAALASSGTDPSANRMVSTFKKVFAAAGLTVRTVTWFDVSAADKTRFGTHISADRTGPCDELDQMLTLSSAHPGNTANLFLVQSISATSTSGGHVVGIDGTIPGPASLSGTVHSGAAVSLSDLFAAAVGCTGAPNPSGCGADEVAFIAAHETGHFLGLFHPTELQGLDFDPLADTPKCPCALCAPSIDRPRCSSQTSSNPVVLSGDLCVVSSSCAGGNNLMFWQLSSASTGVLTSEQAAIMMRSPAMQ
jgi:hypothetical protein